MGLREKEVTRLFRRIILVLAVAAIVVTMVVLWVGMAGADVKEGAGCQGLVRAAEHSENPQVLENAIARGCPVPPPVPEAKAGGVV